jgi:hypothetical protein
MSDNGKKSSPLLKIGVGAVMVILAWFIQYTLTTVSELSGKVGKIEEADAQWGTLAELKENDKEREIQIRVNHELMKIIMEFYRRAEVEENRPHINMPRLPEFEDPEVDPDRFREQQQKRYPTKGK